MKCVICKHGETEPGVTTVTLEGGESTLVTKSTAAEVCVNCGQSYLDYGATDPLLRYSEAEQRAIISERREANGFGG